MKNFLQNKIIALIINARITKTFNIHIKIFQNLFLLSILYLFYNADLLKICEKLNFKTNVIKFVNDVNILAYNINIEKIVKRLKNCTKNAKNERNITISYSFRKNTNSFILSKIRKNST